MHENQVFAIGDRVEQMCTTCGEERGHIVASISKKGLITRVSCPVCKSHVLYKSGSTRRPSTRVGAPYDQGRTYKRGETMMHPTFGEGEVTAVIEPRKIDVLFADRLRRLVHAGL